MNAHMMSTAEQACARLRELSWKQYTGASVINPGDPCYPKDDRFIFVRVPDTRRVAREFRDMPLPQLRKLLLSKIHEERLLALIILVNRARKSSESELAELSAFYLRHLDHVDNWDLVDTSAEHLLGAFLFTKPAVLARKRLLDLARSSDLWRRRVSMVATFYYIRRGRFAETFAVADVLLNDREDLIHKAVGWMLREVGNRDLRLEEEFLKPRYHNMPRTMLRYAIEKFPEPKRQRYLTRRTDDL
jgi:3-methyladenine DNA glycosylase AlkD